MRKVAAYIGLVAGFAALASAQTTDLPAMHVLADSVINQGALSR